MNKNLLFSVTGLVVGLVIGFKVANYHYRQEQNAVAQAAALQAAQEMPRATSVNSSSSKESTPTQSMEQTRLIIERARSNPNDFEAQRLAAEQFLQIQRPEGALEFLHQALRIKPEDPETMASLGEAYFFAQKFTQAIEWSRRALKLRPNYPLATFYLMASLVETGQNLAEADSLLRQLEALRPGDPALAQMRQYLQAAQQQPSNNKSQTVLSHGPGQPRGGKR